MNFAGLRPYQQEHATALLSALQANGCALDASDTGTGKTFVACALARALGVVPLVICPLSVVPSWDRAGVAMDIAVDPINYELVRGTRPRGKERKPAESAYGREVFAGRGSRWQWKHNFEFVIFDEVQRCGGDTTRNSKMLIAARRQCKHVLCLSATAASKPQQLEALGFALGLFELRECKWWLFKHGCAPGLWGGIHFTDDPDEQQIAMAKIHGQIFPSRGARMRKTEIPGFPRSQTEVRLVTDASGKAGALSEKLRAAYLHRAKQEVDAEEDERPLERLLRARQGLEILKVPVLTDFAADYVETSRVAIFVNFSETIDLLGETIREKLGIAAGVIDGRNPKTREQVRQSFQSGDLRIVLVNIAAGGAGLELHALSDYTALISPCYSVTDVRQVLGRGHRMDGGFAYHLFVYFAGTDEEGIANRLASKSDNLDMLNDAELNGVL